ncbi:MAG TPA: Type 1 glutamine amidotransferase-like domain-containing protein [Aggregatilineales bacterium]|nr:Type 1 glutamine amidotransferase-like domain-containing protein [Aggregatilineales bacterium]
MPRANVFRWRDGLGWIVLSGGGDFTSSDTGEIEGQAITRAIAGKPVAYVWAAGDVETADRHLAALEDLGGPTGFLVDVLGEDDESLREQFADAGVVILGDGPDVSRLRSGLLGAAIEGIDSAYQNGAVVVAIGAGASVMGSLTSGADQTGLAWLEGAIVAPYHDREGSADKLREALRKHPELYGIGLATGSGLAFGPEGQVEPLGRRQITIALGAKMT